MSHDALAPQVLLARIAALEALVGKQEHNVRQELAAALEAHRLLHDAHAMAHVDYHIQTQRALERAELTTKETAALHAKAHEREHILAQNAIDKAHDADVVRFEHLNAAGARAIEERSTFANKEATDDKLSALADRLIVVERVGQGSADRVALVNTLVVRVNAMEGEMIALRERLTQVLGNAARIDSLEKTAAMETGRDRGISIVWAVVLAVAALALAAIGLLVKFG